MHPLVGQAERPPWSLKASRVSAEHESTMLFYPAPASLLWSHFLSRFFCLNVSLGGLQQRRENKDFTEEDTLLA